MSDRSPEPDEREWIISRMRGDVPNAVVTGPLVEKEYVVPKSRLDAAMAAADERERELQEGLDQAVTMANDLGGEVRALTEALREARLLMGRVPNEQVVWAIDKGLRAALPVPVEGEADR